jgi:hypothetical protein
LFELFDPFAKGIRIVVEGRKGKLRSMAVDHQ